MKYRYLKFLCLIIAVFAFTGCGSDNDSSEVSDTALTSEISEETSAESATEDANSDSETEDSSTDSNGSDSTTITEVNFDVLSQYNYEFASGAGGWDTEFNIEKDGYFHGLYHDSDRGDSSDDYPDGTVYACVFTGHFSDLTKIDDYTYEMTLADLSYKYDVDTEEISDGIRYVYSDAYGITGTDKSLVYLPGKKISEIDEEVYSWLSMSGTENDVLASLALVNEDQLEGIYSYDRASASVEAQLEYDSCKNSFYYLSTELSNSITTMDMLDYTGQMYQVTDDCLNELWTLIKYNTDEDTYNTILEEQRAWLKQRDADAQQAYDDCEGGSLAPVNQYDVMATETMERCEELLEYLK